MVRGVSTGDRGRAFLWKNGQQELAHMEMPGAWLRASQTHTRSAHVGCFRLDTYTFLYIFLSALNFWLTVHMSPVMPRGLASPAELKVSYCTKGGIMA